MPHLTIRKWRRSSCNIDYTRIKLEQKKNKNKFSSSTGDENTEKILCHIKENINKFLPLYDRALNRINRNPAASKLSFLGKLTKSSISEGSRKRGSKIVRGYIFERDGSNNRSLKSVPEEPSVPETIVQEKSPPRRPQQNSVSQSQERSTISQATTAEEDQSSRQRTTLNEQPH